MDENAVMLLCNGTCVEDEYCCPGLPAMVLSVPQSDSAAPQRLMGRMYNIGAVAAECVTSESMVMLGFGGNHYHALFGGGNVLHVAAEPTGAGVLKVWWVPAHAGGTVCLLDAALGMAVVGG